MTRGVPIMIDLLSDDDDSSSGDGERPPATNIMAAAADNAAVDAQPDDATAPPYRQTIELLAPLFDEIAQACPADDMGDSIAESPITIQRSEAGALEVVFWACVVGPPMRWEIRFTKPLECANASTSGCRNCRYTQLLRALVMLVDKRVLRLTATYTVRYIQTQPCSTHGFANGSSDSNNTAVSTASDTNKSNTECIATLRLNVQLCADAPIGLSLYNCVAFLTHLQPAVLDAPPFSSSTRRLDADVLVRARASTCHVIGCNLHTRDGRVAGAHSNKLVLSDVFHALTASTATEQMEIRDDATYVSRMHWPQRHVLVTDLPVIALQSVVRLLNARDLASLSAVCSLFQHLAYEVVPGLHLVLFAHQRKALKFLLHREAPRSTPVPHPFVFPPFCGTTTTKAIDLVDYNVVRASPPVALDCRGGLFCDEPGLGKTITMLALLLRTKGQRTSTTIPTTTTTPPADAIRSRLRSAESRGRTVHARDVVASCATLLIVPSPLVDHWTFQIATHVDRNALRVFVDTGAALPPSEELATYDVVLTTLERLAREWKFNRPASALEARAPDRYGFEGPARYVDGNVRGDVSSLLRVHWVRVVVDEGHKLGGTAETSPMRMARIFYAQKRWVMTGTPTPNTMHSADLRYMHGLLVFLQDAPYGSPDGKAWLRAIAKPFERHAPIAFLRLQHLLSRIMMRHTKQSINDIVPDPIRHTVLIDPTPNEHDQYNAVAGSARANIVATNYDPKYPGRLHLDSLLNPVNRRYAAQVVTRLRVATCGGASMEILLPSKSRVETINYAMEVGIRDDMLAQVVAYLNRVQGIDGSCSPCLRCTRAFKLLMLIPCGHLCCADCVDDCMSTIGARCPVCNAIFDVEVFQKLQPGFEFDIKYNVAVTDDHVTTTTHAAAAEGAAGVRTMHHNAPQATDTNTTIRQRVPGRPRGFVALDYVRDLDIIDASKALYVVARIKELKREFATRLATGSATAGAARHVKAIVFSQFTDHIWHAKVAFAQQGIPTADFISHVAPAERSRQLHAFRTQASINVLLLSAIGSHGLDLSFVTHIFLLEEIWDKSLEQQVVSRAHRMGARDAVVVEQLVMRGTIEVLLLRLNESIARRQAQRLEATEANEADELQQNDARGRSTDQQHARAPALNLHAMGSQPNHTKHKHKRKATAFAAAPTATATAAAIVDSASRDAKASRLQQQLYYVLQNIRLLGDDIVAAPGHVRFAVEDADGNELRSGSHRMAAYKTNAGELVMLPPDDTARVVASRSNRYVALEQRPALLTESFAAQTAAGSTQSVAPDTSATTAAAIAASTNVEVRPRVRFVTSPGSSIPAITVPLATQTVHFEPRVPPSNAVDGMDVDDSNVKAAIVKHKRTHETTDEPLKKARFDLLRSTPVGAKTERLGDNNILNVPAAAVSSSLVSPNVAVTESPHMKTEASAAVARTPSL